ncbi:MAG TPA: SRPBCC domain-containing protein [Streptosporangiaceae bacterium]
MKTMSAAIEIAAPPMAVWAVLTDLSRYPEWNPLFREAAGDIEVGKRITLRSVHPANGRMMTVKPRIVAAEPGVELRWSASLPGIMSGEHSFTLSPVNGGTRLVQSESFRGLLVPFSGKTFAGAEASFQALNKALKQRAEAG